MLAPEIEKGVLVRARFPWVRAQRDAELICEKLNVSELFALDSLNCHRFKPQLYTEQFNQGIANCEFLES